MKKLIAALLNKAQIIKNNYRKNQEEAVVEKVEKKNKLHAEKKFNEELKILSSDIEKFYKKFLSKKQDPLSRQQIRMIKSEDLSKLHDDLLKNLSHDKMSKKSRDNLQVYHKKWKKQYDDLSKYAALYQSAEELKKKITKSENAIERLCNKLENELKNYPPSLQNKIIEALAINNNEKAKTADNEILVKICEEIQNQIEIIPVAENN